MSGGLLRVRLGVAGDACLAGSGIPLAFLWVSLRNSERPKVFPMCVRVCFEHVALLGSFRSFLYGLEVRYDCVMGLLVLSTPCHDLGAPTTCKKCQPGEVRASVECVCVCVCVWFHGALYFIFHVCSLNMVFEECNVYLEISSFGYLTMCFTSDHSTY